MMVKVPTEHHLEFLRLKGGCRGSSESTHVRMPHCWICHALAIIVPYYFAVWLLLHQTTCDKVFIFLENIF